MPLNSRKCTPTLLANGLSVQLVVCRCSTCAPKTCQRAWNITCTPSKDATNTTATHIHHTQVYGGSVRPRTYTILEVVGCTPGGALSPTVPLEATLKVKGVGRRVDGWTKSYEYMPVTHCGTGGNSQGRQKGGGAGGWVGGWDLGQECSEWNSHNRAAS
jgi:hypothetical protein